MIDFSLSDLFSNHIPATPIYCGILTYCLLFMLVLWYLLPLGPTNFLPRSPAFFHFLAQRILPQYLLVLSLPSVYDQASPSQGNPRPLYLSPRPSKIQHLMDRVKAPAAQHPSLFVIHPHVPISFLPSSSSRVVFSYLSALRNHQDILKRTFFIPIPLLGLWLCYRYKTTPPQCMVLNRGWFCLPPHFALARDHSIITKVLFTDLLLIHSDPIPMIPSLHIA